MQVRQGLKLATDEYIIYLCGRIILNNNNIYSRYVHRKVYKLALSIFSIYNKNHVRNKVKYIYLYGNP